MINATDLKVGVIFVYKSEPYKVLTYKHTHMGRGSADIRLRIQGLISGNVIPLVASPSERFEEADLAKKTMQFLYKEQETLNFMDPKTFEQIELNSQDLGEEVSFLKDGEEYSLLYFNNQPINVMVPPKVVLTVIDCDPGVKGNSATNVYKSAVIEGGIKIKVPLFIKKGEKIRVDTVDRKYVERAK